MLSLPLDFGVADFCSFLETFLSSVREMRIVRSELSKGHCLAFLNFDRVKEAALFYKAYNGKAVSAASACLSDATSALHRLESHIFLKQQHPAEQFYCRSCLQKLILWSAYGNVWDSQ